MASEATVVLGTDSVAEIATFVNADFRDSTPAEKILDVLIGLLINRRVTVWKKIFPTCKHSQYAGKAQGFLHSVSY